MVQKFCAKIGPPGHDQRVELGHVRDHPHEVHAYERADENGPPDEPIRPLGGEEPGCYGCDDCDEEGDEYRPHTSIVGRKVSTGHFYCIFHPRIRFSQSYGNESIG